MVEAKPVLQLLKDSCTTYKVDIPGERHQPMAMIIANYFPIVD
jgi:hypothetical protein